MPLHQFSSQLWGKENQKEKGLPSEEDKPLKYVAGQEGFEPSANGLEGRCSIQLSYCPAREMLIYTKRTLRSSKKTGKCFEI